jgi:hypothetical protein
MRLLYLRYQTSKPDRDLKPKAFLPMSLLSQLLKLPEGGGSADTLPYRFFFMELICPRSLGGSHQEVSMTWNAHIAMKIIGRWGVTGTVKSSYTVPFVLFSLILIAVISILTAVQLLLYLRIIRPLGSYGYSRSVSINLSLRKLCQWHNFRNDKMGFQNHSLSALEDKPGVPHTLTG